MTSDYLPQVPLFQLNLMLHLAFPWPQSQVSLDPVFFRDGYAVRYIAFNVTVPGRFLARSKQAGIEMQESASPEMILEQSSRRQLLTVECKESSFGAESSTAKQGRSLLVACGAPSLPEHIGFQDAGNWKSHLLYAVNGGCEAPMQETLRELSSELSQAGIPACPSASMGIHIRPDGVYLRPCSTAELPVRTLQEGPSEGIRVIVLEEGERPDIFPLIPLDPDVDASDPLGRRIVEERVRMRLSSLIGSHLPIDSFTINLLDILKAATPVWEQWRVSVPARRFKRDVRAYVRKIVSEIRKLAVDVEETRTGEYKFAEISPEVAGRILKYLRSAKFLRGKIDLAGPEMQLEFDDLEAQPGEP